MGEPIVLIPGLGCSALLYEAQTPALWPHGPVQVANHLDGDSMDAIASAILAAAPQQFALAGLSMGGYLAFAIMRMAPARVTRLALLDTAAVADTPRWRRDGLRRSPWPSRATSTAWCGRTGRAPCIRNGSMTQPCAPSTGR